MKGIVVLLLGLVIYAIGLFSIGGVAPLIARKTYISENALMPTAALVEYDQHSWEKAILFHNLLLNSPVLIQAADSQNEGKYLSELSKILNTEGFEASFDVNSASVTAILRSPKGAGTESIIISSSYPTRNLTGIDGLSIGVSLLKHLQKCDWLAKDIILLACNPNNPDCVRLWLGGYLDSSFHLRTGLIQAAINIEVESSSLYQFQSLSVLLESSNGQLPNLDLLNTVHRVVKRETPLKDESIFLTKEAHRHSWLDLTADRIESFVAPLLHQVRKIFPTLSFPVHTGMTATKTLFRFMLNQAIGVPTATHGYFNMFHIDAITLSIGDVHGRQAASHSMAHIGRVLEGTIRSLNNLIEQLHQSFYYYMLPAPILYIPIGDYMISFGLIMFPFLVQLLMDSLSLSNPRLHTHISKVIVMVVTFQLVGVAVFVACLIFREAIQNDYHPVILMGLEIAVTSFIWFRTVSSTEVSKNWARLRTFLSLPMLLFLTVGSLVNISFCMITAAFIIPLLLVRYYCLTWLSKNFVWTWKRFVVVGIQFTLLLFSSPFSLLLAISHLSNQPFHWSFKTIIEHYSQFGTMTFPWLCLIHLPHWTAELLVTLSMLY